MLLRLPVCVSYSVRFAAFCVIILTAAFFAGCSTLNISEKEDCKSRAYLRTPLDEYIKQRFPYGASVRLGIIPFVSPVNFAARNDQQPGAGNMLAYHLQRELLNQQSAAGIIEVLGRSDWPGQTDEFYHGNFSALSMARDAGYDLVLVGLIENPRNMDRLSAFGKLIEVESGITLWNGRAEVSTNRNFRKRNLPTSWWADEQPVYPQTTLLIENLAQCLARDALNENPVPE